MPRTGVIPDLLPDGRPATLYGASAPAALGAPRLAQGMTADVAVVGGGYTGLSTALHLARAGRRVVVLEGATVGAGASGRNGGQVHSGQRLDPATLERLFGLETAREFWRLGEAAKALVAEIAALDPDGCFLRWGMIGAAVRPAHLAEFAQHRDLLAARYDYPKIALLDRDALAAAIGTRRFLGGARDAGAGHLDPYRLALALARATLAAGADVFERTRVTALSRQDRRWCVATEAGATVTADQVVVAANGYLGRLVPAIAAHVLPINNFVAATEPLPEATFSRLIPGGEAVYDTRFVVRYWRPTADRRIVFGGGETYSDRFPADIARFVRPYFAEVYPDLAGVRFSHAWGGTLAVTPQRAPFLRRLEPGLYTACGYSGQGIATATFAGRVLAEAIAGDTDKLDLFARLPTPCFPGGARFRRPLMVLAMTWFAIRDRLGV